MVSGSASKRPNSDSMKKLVKLGALSLLAALVATPLSLSAQTATNKAAATAPAAKKPAPADAKGEKKPSAHPFHGKLAKLDKVEKTLTVGKTVIHVNSQTKIKKDGKPALFEDGIEGEPVSGYVKPDANGQMVASSVNYGAKAEPKPDAKPAPKSEPKPAKQ